MPLQATSGAASYDAFGGGVPVVPNYIEDVFSTYLYTGTGATQSINNGIDLSTKGGLVWTKSRTNPTGTYDGWHALVDTVRGTNNVLYSNATDSYSALNTYVSAFNTNGFNLGAGTYDSNKSSYTYASWSFAKAPKFFDVVTYSGDVPYPGAGVSHNLGSVPGCIICKRTDSTSAWGVWHRANSVSASVTGLSLNTTGSALYTNQNFSSAMTSTSFAPALVNDASGNAMNTAGATYVAYIFAHNAGGFGLTGTDNVISCGSYTGTGAVGNNVTLGYEPQWLMVKNATIADNWIMYDNMRGMPASDVNTGNTKYLRPNLSNAESGGFTIAPTATGFQINTVGGTVNTSGDTYIYIAIRRGPMKVPTSGTSVYKAITYTGTGSADTVTGVGFAPDFVMGQARTRANGTTFKDRLRGSTVHLYPSSDSAEGTGDSTAITSFDMNGISLGTDAVTGSFNESGTDYVTQFFKRAPSFFDEVCYTGTGANRTVTHNLAAVPELMIIRRRSTSNAWAVYANNDNTDYLVLDTTAATADDNTYWNDTSPTSSVFSVGTNNAVNASASTYVAYLFATCAGVSKVGSYTGTATTKQIDCGFTGGARFVLIKRTDSTGSWYVWDSARGIVSGNDPYLLLNTSAVEVTNTDYIDTYSAGFEISSTAPAAINASGGTYIFLAIA